METTYAMIKPNGVKAGLVGHIIERYEMARLAVCGIKIKHMTRAEVEGFYAEHVGKDFFEGLASFMLSGPSVLLAISGENAIAKVRAMNGSTDPAQAAPGTIRHDFACTVRENIVHSSDCAESAAREVAYWFAPNELVNYSTPEFRVGK